MHSVQATQTSDGGVIGARALKIHANLPILSIGIPSRGASMLSRLFSKSKPATAEAHVSRDTERLASFGTVRTDADGDLVVLDIDAPPAQATPEGDHWQDILFRALKRWEVLTEEMPSTPDAALLVQALERPVDSVIRQLPASAQGAMAMCEDPNISRKQLAEQLGKDPALLQALLRTANSAIYSAGRKSVIGLDSAIERIGLASTRAVVMARSVEGLLSRPGGNFDGMLSEVWAHMVRTAPIARAIAPAFRVERDEAFSVALLHDVGKLVIFDQISAMRLQLRRPVAVPTAWLSVFIQETHASLGALALLYWGTGERAAAAAGDHHRADRAEGTNEFAELIYAAERIDHAARKGELLNLESIWKTGRLSGSMEKTEALLAQLAE